MATRALHYVFKIGNRKASYDFFTKVLKMKILRHEEFTEGCKATCNGPYNGKWSKTMVGYGGEDDHFVIELTYNYEIGSYRLGNDFFGIYIDSEEVYQNIKSLGGYEVRPCGKLMVRDPDGHMFMVAPEVTSSRIVRCSVNVQNLEKALDYWTNTIGMSIVNKNEAKKTASLSFEENQCRWELRQLESGSIDRGTAFGRIAFSKPAKELPALEAKIKAAGLPILKELVTLETPGKSDVQVVILADTDSHEICFVGSEGFAELSRIDPTADDVIRKEIDKDDSHTWFPQGKPSG